MLSVLARPHHGLKVKAPMCIQARAGSRVLTHISVIKAQHGLGVKRGPLVRTMVVFSQPLVCDLCYCAKARREQLIMT